MSRITMKELNAELHDQDDEMHELYHLLLERIEKLESKLSEKAENVKIDQELRKIESERR